MQKGGDGSSRSYRAANSEGVSRKEFPGASLRHFVACVLMSRPTYPQVIHNIMQLVVQGLLTYGTSNYK